MKFERTPHTKITQKWLVQNTKPNAYHVKIRGTPFTDTTINSIRDIVFLYFLTPK